MENDEKAAARAELYGFQIPAMRRTELTVTDGTVTVGLTLAGNVALSALDEEDLVTVTLTNAQRRQLIQALGGKPVRYSIERNFG